MPDDNNTTTTTTSANNAPWEPAQPYLQGAMGEADQLFNAGVGSQVYTGSTVVPFSQQTMQGMNNNQAVADQFSNQANVPMNQYLGMMDTLSPIARGDFSSDATFQNNLGQAQEAARDAVNMTAAGNGRYGSGIHQQTMANSIGDLTNRAMLDRQNWAANQLRSYGNDIPAAYQTALMPGQTQMQIGSNYEQLAGNQLNDQLRIFNETQNKPWDNLARMNAITSGAGALGGTSQTTAQVPNTQPSWGQTALGYGLQALGGGLFGGGLF